MILVDVPVTVTPIYIAFSIFFFIYTLNRFTDREEDRVNVPRRAAFIDRYGSVLLPLSIVLYGGGIILAYAQNMMAVVFTLLPVILSVIYSVGRAKRILLGKNIIAGLGWGQIPLMVGAYTSSFGTSAVALSVYFTVLWTVNTVVFDIKDIEGDRKEGISTIPSKFGLEFTRWSTQAVNALLAGAVAYSVLTNLLPARFLVLLGLNLYVAGYIYIARKDYGEWFYGIVVDSEGLITAAVVALAV